MDTYGYELQEAMYNGAMQRGGTMQRVLFTCPSCKTVRAFDYTTNYLRKSVNGTILSTSDDAICPCGGHAKGARVQGRTSDHVCDRKCTHARNTKCECSCGGAGHGAAYLPKDEETNPEAIAKCLAKLQAVAA